MNVVRYRHAYYVDNIDNVLDELKNLNQTRQSGGGGDNAIVDIVDPYNIETIGEPVISAPIMFTASPATFKSMIDKLMVCGRT
jgi:hypothetical protein